MLVVQAIENQIERIIYLPLHGIGIYLHYYISILCEFFLYTSTTHLILLVFLLNSSSALFPFPHQIRQLRDFYRRLRRGA